MTETEKQLTAAVAAQAALIAELQLKLQVHADFADSVTKAIDSAGLNNLKDVLQVADFDFDGSKNARTEMFRTLKNLNEANQILGTVMTFAKALAPLVLV